MEDIISWADEVLFSVPAVKAVAVISLVCASGLALGKIKLRGVGLGVTFVFFTGILAGALGITIDPAMLTYASDFGLIIFVYVLGLQVGPGFISAFRHGGATLNLLGLGLVALGTLAALVPVWMGGMPLGEAVGVLCGATTNTPALAAAQQEFAQLGQPGGGLTAALSLAVTYPVGMVGVILAIMLVKGRLSKCAVRSEEKLEEEAFIASFEVTNPAMFGSSLQDASVFDVNRFVVSRIWRAGKVILPNADTVLESGDRILVITQKRFVKHLTILFGKLDNTDWNRSNIDWNSLDSSLVSSRILVTKSAINGRRLGDLHLRNRFGVNVSRVKRAGYQLVATPDLVMRMGDRITVVGTKDSCHKVAELLGDAVKDLEAPNMITIFLGMVLGLVLGYIPIAVPGISMPLRLGLAGGPIIMGILIGAYGPRLHMVAYVTSSANRLIRSLGLSTYLACLGLDAGPQFIETVMRPAALGWLGFGLLLCVVPVVVVAVVSVVVLKRDFATTAGMLCGSMANPIALEYVNSTLPGDKAAVAYTSVYPICMFVRVIAAQLIVMFMLT